MDDSELLAEVNATIRQARRDHQANSPKPISETVNRLMAKIDSAPEPADAELAERQRAADAKEVQRRQGCWGSLAAKIGRRYAACTLENFRADTGPQQLALESVRAYVANLPANLACGSGVLLYGPPGTGKDHFSTAIMRAAILSGAKVEWIDGADFYGAMRDNIDQQGSERQLLARFRDPDLLAISDPVPPMGKVDSSFQLSMLFRVVDRRYRDQKATLITLNVASREEAEQRLSPNIIDRLGHGALAVHCNWPSYRR